jgi:hypothetical protein
VWGFDPSEMNTEWMGERVATVDLARLTGNIVTVRHPAGLAVFQLRAWLMVGLVDSWTRGLVAG